MARELRHISDEAYGDQDKNDEAVNGGGCSCGNRQSAAEASPFSDATAADFPARVAEAPVAHSHLPGGFLKAHSRADCFSKACAEGLSLLLSRGKHPVREPIVHL
jgi:hypothetical protein